MCCGCAFNKFIVNAFNTVYTSRNVRYDECLVFMVVPPIIKILINGTFFSSQI
jgi:hypothetical protein